jgi:hypothetical protein
VRDRQERSTSFDILNRPMPQDQVELSGMTPATTPARTATVATAAGDESVEGDLAALVARVRRLSRGFRQS